jgi:crotonobetainyl-CoA:carnitine CoA-transferase CaiB-like acyl-CoA transferase
VSYVQQEKTIDKGEIIMSNEALSGIRVVEITSFQQGPVAGMRLGDLGADVIKVEPKYGDPARRHMSTLLEDFSLKGYDYNYYFEHANRNKRGIVLDMKNKKGLEVFLRLIDTADVFLNNMSIGAPGRLGIGPDALLARNPRLIYAHASGWGRKGPSANDLSFDYTGIARSGLMMRAPLPAWSVPAWEMNWGGSYVPLASSRPSLQGKRQAEGRSWTHPSWEA